MDVKIFEDKFALGKAAAALGAEKIRAAIAKKGSANVILATGASQFEMLAALLEEKNIDWSVVKFFHLDEYVGLPAENDQSYRYFMNDNLFNHINIRKDHTFVPNGLAKDVNAECAEYEKRIEELGGIDLQLLGIGGNGHVGFNEPSDAFDTVTHVVELKASTREANARFFASIDEVPTHALTMGLKGIMGAKKVLLVANGPQKAEIVEKAFFGPVTPEVPASILQLHPDVTVIYTASKD